MLLDGPDLGEDGFDEMLELDLDEVEFLDDIEMEEEEDNEDNKLPIYGLSDLESPEIPMEADKSVILPVVQKLGYIYSSKLEQPLAAISRYRFSLELEKNDTQVFEILEKLYIEESHWSDLKDLLLARIDLCADDEASQPFRYQLAQLLWEHLEDTEGALGFLQELLKEVPDHPEANPYLEDILIETLRYDELALHFRGRLDRHPDDQPLRLQLARIHEEELKKPLDALILYREVLEARPKDLDVLKAIETIFVSEEWDRSSKAEELLPILKQLRNMTEDISESATFSYRIGEILDRSLDRADEAIDWYAKALVEVRDYGQPVQALEALTADEYLRPKITAVLEPHYRNTEQWNELIKIIDLKLADLETSEEKNEALLEISSIYEDKLEDLNQAFTYSGLGFLAHPQSDKSLANLERLTKAGGSSERYAEYLEDGLATIDEAGAEEDQEITIELCQRLGRLYRSELANTDRAIELYEKALSLDWSNDTALMALDELYLEANLAPELARIVELEVNRSDVNPEMYDKEQLLIRLAVLREERLDDFQGAATCYEQVSSLNPDRPDVRAALERIYPAVGEWQKFGDILILELQDDEEGVERLKQAAEVFEEKVGDLNRAIELHERILVVFPGDVEELKALARLFADPSMAGRDERRFEVLETLYGVLEDEQEQIGIRFQQAELLSGPLDDVARALEMYGEVLGKSEEEHAAALEALELWCLEDEYRAGAGKFLEPHYRETSAWQKLVDLYEARLQDIEESAEKADLLQTIGGLLEEQLDNLPAAFDAYGRAYGADQGNANPLDEMERLAVATNSHESLLEHYWEFLKIEELAERRVRLGLKRGEIHEQILDHVEQAVEDYRQVLSVEGANREALEGLDRIFTRKEEWAELKEIIEERVGIVTGQEEEIALRLRLGTLLESKFDFEGQAINNYRRVLELEPANAEAVETLTRVFSERAEHELRRDIASLLNAYYSAQEDPEGLLWVAEGLLAVTPEGEAGPLLSEAVRLCDEELNEPGRAFLLLSSNKMEMLQPGRFDELERLADGSDMGEQLISVFDQMAATVEDQDKVAELYIRGAKWSKNRREDLAGAAERYVKAHEIKPDDQEIFTELESIYQIQMQYDLLLDLYLQAVGREQTLPQKVELYRKIGALRTQEIEDLIGAAEAYEAILDLEIKDEEILKEACSALEKIYPDLEEWEKYARILIHGLTDDEAGVERLKRAAQVMEVQVEDYAEAVALHERILQAFPGDIEELKVLSRLLSIPAMSGREERHFQVLEMLFGSVEEVREKYGIRYKQAELLAGPLDDAKRAIGMYGEVLQGSPDYEQALRALEEWAGISEYRPLIGAYLEPHYREVGAWEKLVALYEERLQDIPEADQQAALLVVIGGLQEEKLDNLEAAFKAHGRAYLIDRSMSKPLDDMERLSDEMAEYEALVDQYQVFLADETELDRQIRMSLKRGQVHEQVLRKDEAAIEDYQRVLSLEENNLEALEGLDRIFTTTWQWSELREILDQRISLASEDKLELELRLRLGALLEAEFNFEDPAIDNYRRILVMDEENDEAVETLRKVFSERDDYKLRKEIFALLDPFYSRSGDSEARLLITEGLLTVAPAAEKPILIKEAVHLCDENLDDPLRAFKLLEKAGIELLNSEQLDEMERLAKRAKLDMQLVEVFDGLAERMEDSERSSDLYLRGAYWCKEQLSDSAGAAERFSKVYEIRPDDLSIFGELEIIYQAEMLYDELLGVYLKAVEREQPKAQQVELYRKIGALRIQEINDPRGAAEAYEAILELAAEDEEALTEACGALEKIYPDIDEWEKYANILIHGLDDDQAGADRLRKSASVMEEKVGDLSLALELHERILAAFPGDAEELKVMSRILAAPELAGREERRFEVLEELYQAVEEERERLGIRYQQAELLTGPLNDVGRAISLYGEVLQAAPDHEDALGALEKWVQDDAHRRAAGGFLEPYYREVGAWQKLVTLYENSLQDLESDKDRAGLLQTIGGLLENQLDNPQEAFAAQARAYGEDRTSVKPLEELERLAEDMGDYEALVEQYGAFHAEEQSAEHKVRMSLKKGQIHERILADNEKAVEDYRQALEAEAGNYEALEGLDRIFTVQENWSELREVLERRIGITEEPQAQVALRLRAGALLEANFHFEAPAINHYQKILALEPKNIEAIETLKKVFSEHDEFVLRRQIFDLLDPYFLAKDNKKGQLWLTEGLLSVAPDEERGALVHEAVRLCDEELDNPARAFYLLRQYGTDLLLPGLFDELERLAQRADLGRQLVEVFDELTGMLEGDDRIADLHLRSARWCKERLQDIEGAAERFEKVQQLWPDDREIFGELEGIYKEHKQYEQLDALYIGAVGRDQTVEQKIELYRKIGSLKTQEMGDFRGAADAYEAILEIAPDNEEAFELLTSKKGLYRRLDDNAGLARLLEARIDLQEAPEVKKELALQAADTWSKVENSEERIESILHKVLEIEPENALILSRLKNHYYRSKKWEDFLELSAKLAGLADQEPSKKARELTSSAMVAYEKLEKRPEGLKLIREALELAPRNVEIWTNYQLLLEKEEAWAELLDAYEKSIPLIVNAQTAVDMGLNAAKTAEEKLEDPERAIKFLKGVILRVPAHQDAHQSVLRCYDLVGRWKESFDFMKKQVKLLGETPLASELLYHMGVLCEEKGGNMQAAEQCYYKVYKSDPQNRMAIQGLRRVYTKLEQWDRVIQSLKLEDRLADKKDKLNIRLEMGRIFRDQFKDIKKAAMAFEACFNIDPHNADVAVEMIPIYSLPDYKLPDSLDLDMLENSLSLYQIVDKKADRYFQLGEIAERLNDETHALRFYQESYDHDPAHIPALLGIARTYFNADDHGKALNIYQKILLYDSAIRSDNQRIDVYYHLGLIRKEMGDKVRAEAMFKQALDIDPYHKPSREALQDLK